MRQLVQLGHVVQHKFAIVYCDNNSTIKLSKNSMMHGRNKHIDIRVVFLQELIKDEIVNMVHCHTQQQVVDIITKAFKA